MKGLEDISLVTQVAVFHNRRAFDRLVVKYQSPIRRFFLHQTLGDGPLSDDLAQETFIKAYTNITQFRGLSSFPTWLFRIAYNVLYDYNRRLKPTSELTPQNDSRRPSAPTATLEMDLYDALRRLGEKERTCITLQLIDGYALAEISQITGMAIGTVKSHIFRGKEKLTTYLKQNGYDRT